MTASEILQTVDVAVSADMDEREAREAVDDIKKGINTVRARIYELDRRKGWKALGYRSFTACCMDQFPELHAKYVEKQLVQWDFFEAYRKGRDPVEIFFNQYREPYIILGNTPWHRDSFMAVSFLSAPKGFISYAKNQQLSFA